VGKIVHVAIRRDNKLRHKATGNDTCSFTRSFSISQDTPLLIFEMTSNDPGSLLTFPLLPFLALLHLIHGHAVSRNRRYDLSKARRHVKTRSVLSRRTKIYTSIFLRHFQIGINKCFVSVLSSFIFSWTESWKKAKRDREREREREREGVARARTWTSKKKETTQRAWNGLLARLTTWHGAI
jgi:hypothetical protein